MLRGLKRRVCLGEPALGVYKYVLCAYVQNQPAMRDLRAVILLIWRIWARYNSRRIVRVPVPTRILASSWRVFLISICFGDGCRCHRWVARFGINHIPAPLRVQTGAQYKHPGYNC
jgi:hypothetical protein